MQAAAEKSEEHRLMGYHCSESCIRACSEVLDIKLPEEILKISSAFRGGGGGYGDRCGMLEAGMILISYLYGRTDPKVDVSDYSYLIRILHDRFLAELGGIHCRILKPFAYYLSGEAQNCSHVYKKGAEIVMEVLLEADRIMKEMPDSERYENQKGLPRKKP